VRLRAHASRADALIPLEPTTHTILNDADTVVCVLFLFDFMQNLIRAPNKVKYFATWGWIDLLSSIPALDAFRLGRAARLLRILRVLRAVRSVRVLGQFIMSRRGESVGLAAALAALLAITFSSVGVLQVELPANGNIQTAEDAVWWSISTLTTVGYGDRYPTTSEGRLIAVLLMVCGVGLVSVLAGLVASWFLSPAAQDADDGLRELKTLRVQLREQLESLKQADGTRRSASAWEDAARRLNRASRPSARRGAHRTILLAGGNEPFDGLDDLRRVDRFGENPVDDHSDARGWKSGQREDRRVAQIGMILHPGEQIGARDSREHQVDEDDAGPEPVLEELPGALAVFSDHDPITREAEKLRERDTCVLVVFDEQNRCLSGQTNASWHARAQADPYEDYNSWRRASRQGVRTAARMEVSRCGYDVRTLMRDLVITCRAVSHLHGRHEYFVQESGPRRAPIAGPFPDAAQASIVAKPMAEARDVDLWLEDRDDRGRAMIPRRVWPARA
jgi:voltage-gated potassium channel